MVAIHVTHRKGRLAKSEVACWQAQQGLKRGHIGLSNSPRNAQPNHTTKEEDSLPEQQYNTAVRSNPFFGAPKRILATSCLVAVALTFSISIQSASAKTDEQPTPLTLAPISDNGNSDTNSSTQKFDSNSSLCLSTPSLTDASEVESSRKDNQGACGISAKTTAFDTVGQYDIQIESHKELIPFRSFYKMSSDVDPGKVKQGQAGQNGIREKRYQVYYKKGSAVKSNLLSNKVIKEPIDHVTYCGVRLKGARSLPSRSGQYDRLRELSMVATGYSPKEGSKTGRCATGMKAGYGVVAVDPRVIPLHSKLYIEGYGYAVAGDTGGAIKRNRIDLGHNSYHDAARVGRRKVHVYVLKSK